MSEVVFVPGPTQLYPGMGQFIGEAIKYGIGSISHRGEEFKQTYRETATSLRLLLNLPDAFTVAFVGSATEAMERVVQGCARARSFHFVNGAFSSRFRKIARSCGLDARAAEAPDGEGFPTGVALPPAGTELICITHNETSTGVAFPREEIARIREGRPDALLVVDVTSSVPAVPFDYGSVDCALFSVQKGFGLPAGLGVLLFNQRCVAKARELEAEGRYTGSFHGMRELADRAKDWQTVETPNVLGIHLLGRVAGSLLERGVADVHQATARKAAKLYGALESHAVLEPFVRDGRVRSETVLTVSTGDETERVLGRCEEAGYLLGRGYGPHRASQVRIANFPAHGEVEIDRLIGLL